MSGTEIYLIAIVFLASQAAAYVIAGNESSTFEAQNECPAVDPCPPKLIAYEGEDCTRYYECKNQEKISKTCKTGLHFSVKWQGCVEPENSECEDDGGEGGNDEESKCEKNGDLLPHECQCTKFYECKSKHKTLRDCPLGEFFDKTRKICVPGKNCKPVGTECKDGDLINHECQCNKYYLCKNGQKALQECKKGYHFDSDSSKCVKGSCPNDDVCTSGDKKSHECLCEKYYACKSKEWILQECGKDKHFSPTDLKCMEKKRAGCSKPGNPDECPKNVPTLWRHECDCRLYYECVNDKKQVQACAWGKYFDYVNQVCETAKKVSSKCHNSWDDWL